MLEGLTPPAELAVTASRALASGENLSEADSRHLLLALIGTPGTSAQAALKNAGVKVSDISVAGEEEALVVMVVASKDPQDLPPARLAADTEAIVRRARSMASDMGHSLVGTEHLLLAILERPGTNAGRILEQRGVTAEAMRRELFG